MAPPGRGGMLPGLAPPGRGGIPPGAGLAPGGTPGWGRGIARSTGCTEENGLLPTRRGRGPPGLGAAGPGSTPDSATGVAAVAAGAGGATGAAGVGAAGAAGGAAGGGTTGAAATLAGAAFFAGGTSAGFDPPSASRSRRATGASTVDDADLTNSPCSLSRARTSLLVTPSSFANSCTRALPATTSPSLEAWGGPRLGFSYDALSSPGLHGVLMSFRYLFLLPAGIAKCSSSADVSGEPVIRSARAKACRRTAAARHRSTGCNHAPRPGWEPDVSTVTADCPFPIDTATTRSSSTANSRFRQPMHVRTGPPVGVSAAVFSRWITTYSTVTAAEVRTAAVRRCPEAVRGPG